MFQAEFGINEKPGIITREEFTEIFKQSESGYNMFNENDSFYNDICSTYTTENGTDMNLNDRQHAIEEVRGSLNLCQVGCKLKYYNSTNNRINCDCDLKSAKTIIYLDDIEFSSNLIDNLFIGLN